MPIILQLFLFKCEDLLLFIISYCCMFDTFGFWTVSGTKQILKTSSWVWDYGSEPFWIVTFESKAISTQESLSQVADVCSFIQIVFRCLKR